MVVREGNKKYHFPNPDPKEMVVSVSRGSFLKERSISDFFSKKLLVAKFQF